MHQIPPVYIVMCICECGNMWHNLWFTLHHALNLRYVYLDTRFVLNPVTPLKLL
jgi:hypothetical protein